MSARLLAVEAALVVAATLGGGIPWGWPYVVGLLVGLTLMAGGSALEDRAAAKREHGQGHC